MKKNKVYNKCSKGSGCDYVGRILPYGYVYDIEASCGNGGGCKLTDYKLPSGKSKNIIKYN